MLTAILVDGEFFLRRHKKCYGPLDDAEKVAKNLFTMCIDHVKADGGNKTDLYRILFYDCEPLSKKVHKPISGQAYDFSKTHVFAFRTSLHKELVKMRKVAIRLGRLAEGQAAWRIRAEAQKELLKGTRVVTDLLDNDFIYDVSQKGVDMKIGLDISSIAHKHLARKVVLISGDADFVPAAKHARREGIDFVLDPMFQPISDDLQKHVDGLKSFCPHPSKLPAPTPQDPSDV